MAPGLHVPLKFGLDRCTPTKDVDVYATATTTYQALTAQFLTGKFDRRSWPEVVFEVLARTRPSKPRSASELGLCDRARKPLEGCWKAARELRLSVKNVVDSVKSAASTCDTVPFSWWCDQIARGHTCYILWPIFLDLPSS